jgi:hypothetical protein
MITLAIQSKNMDDILDITLSRNIKRIGNLFSPWVITEEGMPEIEVAKKYNVPYFCHPFKSPKGNFMKEAAFNAFFNSNIYDKTQPICSLDNDIIFPTNMGDIINPFIEQINTEEGALWGILRRQLDDIKKVDNYNTSESIRELKFVDVMPQVWGYFQMFLPKSIGRKNPYNEFYEINKEGRLNPDGEIRLNFRVERMMKINSIHIGKTEQNWFGRVSERIITN